MKRYILLALLAVIPTSGAVADSITVDNCDDPLVFDTAPERIVVHDMNMTDMAFALGLQDKIVGLTGITGWYKTSPEFDELRGDIPELAPKYPTIENLCYDAANGTALVQGVSFSVDEGTILAIAGPNGAGKTTLLRLLSGTEAPTGGDILISGHNLKQFSATERARMIAVVSQQELTDVRLSLYDYVALGQIPIRTDR